MSLLRVSIEFLRQLVHMHLASTMLATSLTVLGCDMQAIAVDKASIHGPILTCIQQMKAMLRDSECEHLPTFWSCSWYATGRKCWSATQQLVKA